MKTQYLLFLMFLLFASCEKKQEEDLLPTWLEEIINERNQNDLCYYTSAMRYQWNGQYYYELYSPLSSCFLCDVFDQSGQRVNWESYEEVEDYELNKTDQTVIWVCDI